MNYVPLVDNLMNKHMFLSWFVIHMFILHNEKFEVKGYVPSHVCFYFQSEVLMVWLIAKHETKLPLNFDHCVGLVWLMFCSHIMIRIQIKLNLIMIRLYKVGVIMFVLDLITNHPMLCLRWWNQVDDHICCVYSVPKLYWPYEMFLCM
jgi:hypothetical protein